MNEYGKKKRVTVTGTSRQRSLHRGTRFEIKRLNLSLFVGEFFSVFFPRPPLLHHCARLTILVRSDYVSKRTRDFATDVSSFNASRRTVCGVRVRVCVLRRRSGR